MAAEPLPEFPSPPCPPLSDSELEERFNANRPLFNRFAKTADMDTLVDLMHAVLDAPPTR